MNAILDEADQSPSETFVDSYDVKQVVRPNDKHNNKTWRQGEYQDHTYDQSRNNAITPMSHLFLRQSKHVAKSNSTTISVLTNVTRCSGQTEGRRQRFI